MSVTVFIWNNNVVGKKTYPGHAALHIRENKLDNYDQEMQPYYVSWLPMHYRESHSGNTAAKPGKNILTDLVYETYAPDHVITIPATAVHESRMLLAYRDILSKAGGVGQLGRGGPSYRKNIKNCSTIAQRVLKAGGMPMGFNLKKSIIIKNFKLHTVWTPLDVKNFAETFKGSKRHNWEDWVDDFASQSAVGEPGAAMLKLLQRRHARHGSSEAPARNRSKCNTRILHTLGETKSSPYKNKAILDLLQTYDSTQSQRGHAYWMRQCEIVVETIAGLNPNAQFRSGPDRSIWHA